MSKFLTYEDRMNIALGLKEQLSFTVIADSICKDRTAIAKEVKKHAIDKRSGYSGWPYNACRKRADCRKQHICPTEACTHKSTVYCKLCNRCNDCCSDFVEEVCTVKMKPPYVCNGCADYGKCTLKKSVYDPAEAQLAAMRTISEARSGILSCEDELERLNGIISPLVKNGQSVHQIYANRKDELMCSERTVYNYIDASLFDVRSIDLPRKVRFRPRYKKPEFKVDRGCRIGRNYEDFLKFMDKYPDTHIVQMDSLMGARGSGKCLLTVHFVDTSLMLAFLRDANTSQSAIDVFGNLFAVLKRKNFEKLFPVILTDNGSEFSNPRAIEYGPCQDDLLRTRIFYCDPSSPYQKGSLEVNHELIRRVVPKGTSLSDLTQSDVKRMMDHINSYKRKKLNDRSPYDAFSFLYGEELLQLLGCSQVPAENIILKPRLLIK